MEELIRIESFKWYPNADRYQMCSLMDTMRQQDSRDYIIVPDPLDSNYFRGIILAKYYIPVLSQVSLNQETVCEDDFQFIYIPRKDIRGYVSCLTRRIMAAYSNASVADLGALRKEPTPPTRSQLLTHFLQEQSPAQIEAALNEIVLGQPDLTKTVADFLYYHALRQLHPQLPQRPMLISGPSGSGKTEVWRTVKQLYGELFSIKIIDGSSLSCDGWAGSYKLSTYIDAEFTDGGILVVDEFDKLARPKYSSGSENVSLNMQAEFLKLIEGEFQVTEKRKETGATSKKMGFAFVGAFEDLRERKEAASATPAVSPIGFHAQQEPPAQPAPHSSELTDEDFIRFGIMPEIVGRISSRCVTRQLDAAAYLSIIRSPHSRVHAIELVLQRYGIKVTDVLSREALEQIIAESMRNRTGVRWVCAQVENRLLESIRERGLFPSAAPLGAHTPTAA